MTPAEYRTAGFRMSLQMSQQIIDRAEAEVVSAYVDKIVPDLSPTDALYKEAVMTLAFMLLARRNVFVTRSGAKTKQSPEQSSDSDVWYNTMNLASDCDLTLKKLRALDGAVENAKVDDICGIYFSTNYWHS